MKLLLPFVFLSVITCFSQVNLQKEININGQMRSYKIYVPAIYNASISVPLVFNFHGYTSNMNDQELYTNFNAIADTANFILIHPQGLDIGNGFGWNSFTNTDNSNYDYQFIDQLIDDISENYNVNANKIYSTGLSNGGFFSYDLACFMSNRFAAIASVAGSMISSHLNLCNPGRPIPIMQIHGTNDLTVSYSGTGGIITSTSVDDLVGFWRDLNSCSINPIQTNLPNINTNDLSTVEHYIYESPNQNGEVELYKVLNGGHTWPGATFALPGLVTNQDLTASKEIWRFFLKYSKPQSSIGIKENKINATFNNPVTDVLKINNLNKFIESITLNNSTGIYKNNYDTKNLDEIEINVENLENGVYFITYGDKTYRFIKI